MLRRNPVIIGLLLPFLLLAQSEKGGQRLEKTGVLVITATPGDPPSGQIKVYGKNDAGTDKLCSKNAAGTEACGLGGAGGGGYDTIQDEATPLTQRTTVNFTGAGVACADNPGSSRTDCTIAGGGSGVTVEEADTVPSVAATIIQFDQADGLTVTDETGGQVQIDLVNAPDSAVADNITLTNITQITNRAITDTTGDLPLSTRTSGNYLEQITGGTGIVITGAVGEAATQTPAFDFTDAGADPALNAEECRFSNEGASDGGWVCEGVTSDTIETRFRVTDPTTSDKVITFPDATGEVSVLGQSIALGTETTGNYVLDVADGTGIDGTAAGVGATYTPTLDLTEVNSVTFGDNSQATVTHTVDPTGTTNPAWSYTDGVVNLSTGNLQEGGSNVLTVADQNAGTDITADLEEETHASEHTAGGNDIITVDGTDAGAATTRTSENPIQLSRHNTDCTSLTDGSAGEPCWEKDANVLYVCEPTAGGCDTPAEWVAMTAAGDGTGYDTVQDEGTPLTQRGTVNFIGASITCADNAGSSRTDCTISGGAGGDAIEVEDGDDLGTFTPIDTTARFEDQGDINFTFADGGAGGPDTITATVRADSVALTTDTTGNYTATIADAGNSTIAVVNGTAEGGAVTLDAIDVNCTNCLGTAEIDETAAYSFSALATTTISGGNLLTDEVTATVNNDAIGVTSTDGLIIDNTTAAAAGAQQWSPRMRFTGQGWKTDATAASQTVDWIVENQPVQDDTRAATKLVFSSQANGGGYTPHLEIVDYDTGQQPTVPSGWVNARGTATNTSGAVDGIGMIMVAAPTASTSSYYEGGDFFVQATTANPYTRALGGIIGAGTWTEGNQSGLITSMVGFQAYADVESTGDITSLKLFEALTPDQFSTGAFQTVYGLYVRDQTAGAVANFSIFTESGNAEINTGAAGTVGLRVDGTTSQTANLQEWRDVTPSVVASVSASGVISSAAGTSAGNVATIDGTQTLTNKTLTTPTIASFANATHDHTNAAGGGTLGKTAIPSTTVYTDQANTYSTGAQSFAAATSFTAPTSAGAAPTANGTVAYDSTANALEYGDNGTNRTVANLDEAQTLTNKTIDAASNTVSNVAPSMMTTAARSVDKSINIFDPTTSDTNKIQWDYGAAVTITEVHCSTDVGTVTIQLDERVKTTPNTAGTNVMTASLVCDSDDQSTASFTNAGIAADAPVNLQITATATSPTIVRIHVQATRD